MNNKEKCEWCACGEKADAPEGQYNCKNHSTEAIVEDEARNIDTIFQAIRALALLYKGGEITNDVFKSDINNKKEIIKRLLQAKEEEMIEKFRDMRVKRKDLNPNHTIRALELEYNRALDDAIKTLTPQEDE